MSAMQQELAQDNQAAAAPARLRALLGLRVCAAAVVALAVVALDTVRTPWIVARELAAARGTGLLACSALVASLAVRPLAERLPLAPALRAQAPVLRRALGMAAAWLGLVHALTAFLGPLQGEPFALVRTSHALSGLTALALLVLLLVTSFAAVVRALRLSLWKPVHRLAYVAALLVAQHAALSAGGSRTLVGGNVGVLLFATLALLLLRALPASGTRR